MATETIPLGEELGGRRRRGGGLSSLRLGSGAASVSPASRCQRRSSLPQFASEHGYRPRPEELLGPKQQFVPERWRLGTAHPSGRYPQCQQYQKGESAAPPTTHPRGPKPRHLYENELVRWGGKKGSVLLSQFSESCSQESKSLKRSLQTMLPTCTPTPTRVLGRKVTAPLAALLCSSK